MADFRMYRRRLPHVRVREGTYFVTWRLHRAQPELAPAERTLVANALRHFDGERYQLLAFVVMNDHVHVILGPREPHRLEDIVRSWKSYTANRLQRTTDRYGTGRVWQDEYFDRALRDEKEFLEKIQYIVNNPWTRWPEIQDYPWVWALGEVAVPG